MAKKFDVTPSTTEANPNPVSYRSKAAKEQALKELGIEEIIKDKIRETSESLAMELEKLKRENGELQKKINETTANIRSNEKAVAQLSNENLNRERISYPTEVERKSTVITELENRFKAYGVGVKALRFIRRHYKGDMMIKPTAVVTRNGEVVRLAYAYNHESPFVDDHPTDPAWHAETNPIRFTSSGEESSIIVPPTNPSLQRFLIANPMFGSEYYLEDKVKKAAEQLEYEDKIDKAVQQVNRIFEDKSHVLPRMLGSYLLPGSMGVSLSLKELKYECRTMIRRDPELLYNFEKNQDYAEKLYLFFKSQDMGLLEVKDRYIYTTWNNKKLTAVTTTPEESFAHSIGSFPNYVSLLKEKTGFNLQVTDA